jgi:hypothetical protein
MKEYVKTYTLLHRVMKMQTRYSPIPTYVLRHNMRLRMHKQEVFTSDSNTICTPMNYLPNVPE